jgi:hypothetical protein
MAQKGGIQSLAYTRINGGVAPILAPSGCEGARYARGSQGVDKRRGRSDHMKHAIRLTLAVTILAALYLASCSGGEPKIKADTESDFTSSYAAVIKGMSTEDKQQLDDALKDIVLVQVGLYGPMFDAKHYQLPSSERHSGLFGNGLEAVLAGASGKMTNAAITIKWGENRAKEVVENARRIIDEHTAKEIIRIATDERQKALESAIATYQEQVYEANLALKDIQNKVEAPTKRQDEQNALLGLASRKKALEEAIQDLENKITNLQKQHQQDR